MAGLLIAFATLMAFWSSWAVSSRPSASAATAQQVSTSPKQLRSEVLVLMRPNQALLLMDLLTHAPLVLCDTLQAIQLKLCEGSVVDWASHHDRLENWIAATAGEGVRGLVVTWSGNCC
jgi:hypothetical protein